MTAPATLLVPSLKILKVQSPTLSTMSSAKELRCSATTGPQWASVQLFVYSGWSTPAGFSYCA